MVGIGAGIPRSPMLDIRLGDIAVSIPRDSHLGVVEYDFRKYELSGTFVLKGSLDKPPLILISANCSLEEDKEMNRSRLTKILRGITKQPRYTRPNSGDVLFDTTFHYINKEIIIVDVRHPTKRRLCPAWNVISLDILCLIGALYSQAVGLSRIPRIRVVCAMAMTTQSATK